MCVHACVCVCVRVSRPVCIIVIESEQWEVTGKQAKTVGMLTGATEDNY